jgi:hypothetical protein
MAVSKRNWAAVAVIICWGVALGWLGLRRVGQTDASRITTQAALRMAPGDAWFRVMSGTTQFGYAGITLDTLADGTYRIREQVNLELPADSGLTRAIRSTEFYLGASLGVDSLVSRRSTMAATEVLRGITRGGGWDLEFRPGDTVVAGRGRLALTNAAGMSPTLVPSRVVPLRLGLVGSIATGDSRRLALVSGWPPAASEAEVVISGDSVAIFADSSDLNPATGTWEAVSWDTVATRSIRFDPPSGPVRMAVDGRGTVVEIEYPFGVRWIREEFSIARFNFRNRLAPDGGRIREALPALLPLAGSAAAADTSRSRRTWDVTRRDGARIDPEMLAMFAGGRQIISQRGRLSVIPPIQVRVRESRPPLADPLIQSEGAVAEFAATLTPLIESDDLAGVARAVRRRVRIDTASSASVDAASALANGVARPDGLARLLAAVLERHDIAARYVIGVMPRGDTLFTHAWVEFASGRGPWDTIDPLTGERASSGLIRLARAGSSHPQDLMPYVADVRFIPASEPAPEGDGP